MRRPAILAAALLLPLAATAQDMAIQPGKWQTTITVTDVQMPGGPPGIAAAMKGRPTTVTSCITPAQAKAGPRAALKADSGCRFTDYRAAGGRIATKMVCNRPGGAMTAVSTGSYTATSYDMVGRAVMTGATRMTVTSRTTAKRIGAC